MSLKNVIRRKIHKERAQPYERQKLGLLEKKKDYRLRAKDYHRKTDTIKRLKEKAALKNPDEFYFKMNSSKTKDGVHNLERNNRKDADTLKTWNTQDLGLLNMKYTQVLKKIERLRSRLHNLSGAPTPKRRGGNLDSDDEDDGMARGLGGKCNKRVVFVDSEQELQEHLAQETAKQEPKEEKKVSKKIEKEKDKSYKELQDLLDTKGKLERLRRRLQQQKDLMGKGARTKQITEDKFGEEIKAKTVYKWKLERKK